MSDSLAQAIDARLKRYLQGDDSLAEFEAWLVPETWDLSPQSDRHVHDLATSITLRIAEFTSGDWTEEELRDALTQLQRPILSPLIQAGGDLHYPNRKGELVIGRESHPAKEISLVGTGRSEVVV